MRSIKTGVLASVALCVISAAWVTVPALGQAAGGRQEKNPAEARQQEIARLVESGQLKLRDAIALAEKETHGAAIEARCTVEPVAGAEKPRGPSADASKQLIYEVVCFANGKMSTVHVNGLTRKVTPVEPTRGSGG